MRRRFLSLLGCLLLLVLMGRAGGFRNTVMMPTTVNYKKGYPASLVPELAPAPPGPPYSCPGAFLSWPCSARPCLLVSRLSSLLPVIDPVALLAPVAPVLLSGESRHARAASIAVPHLAGEIRRVRAASIAATAAAVAAAAFAAAVAFSVAAVTSTGVATAAETTGLGEGSRGTRRGKSL